MLCVRTPKILPRQFHIVSKTQDIVNHPNANYNDDAKYNSWPHFKAYYIMRFYMNIDKNIT